MVVLSLYANVQFCLSKMFRTPVTPHETNLLLSEITVWHGTSLTIIKKLIAQTEMQKRTSGTSAACVKFPSWCKNSGGERDNGWCKKFLCRESRNFGVIFLVLRSIYLILLTYNCGSVCLFVCGSFSNFKF